MVEWVTLGCAFLLFLTLLVIMALQRPKPPGPPLGAGSA